MGLSFEVRQSDLLGRLGTLKVGSRSVETPCLFPVIHPVVQAVSTSDIWRMGFRGVMTNSYIIYSRRKEEALQKGVHKLVDFPGMVMTDSGGYQVLEYGDLGLDVREVAAFQQGIGSDAAVTLDRPTGYSTSRDHAEETVKVSLDGAVETMRDFGDGKTVWVGPVQGGIFHDLLRRSAKSLLKAGFEFLALGSPTQVMESYRFAELAGMIAAVRKEVPYAVPLHLFGAGHPLTMPLAVALGCDTFDSASYILFARRGNYMTERGVVAVKELQALPCSCEVCVKTSATELQSLEEKERVARVATHNLWVLRKEVETCKEAIAEGRLWDLVVERSSSHPQLREALAVVSRESEILRDGTRFTKEKGLFIGAATDLERPEVAAARERLADVSRRRSKYAVLHLGEVSPSRSPRFKKGGVDNWRVHPVFGVFPAELDFVYPFTQTITSSEIHGPTEAQAVKKLRAMGYSTVKVAGRPREGAKNRRKPKAASPSAR